MFPGVFIEEAPGGARPIEGVATSIATFVGAFPAGPLDRAVLVLSAADLRRGFGGGGAADRGVRQFFLNGGGAAYVVRVAADGGAPTAAALLGDRAAKTGLHALDEVDLFNLLCLPEAADLPPEEARAVYAAAAAYCEERRALLLVDAPESAIDAAGMQNWVEENSALRHANAAAYFPRLRVDGRTAAASGAVAGLYARMDVTRGVWTAPAGAEALLRGVEATAHVTDRESTALNALGINSLREFPGAGGLVAWGARTLAVEPEWRFVPIRRFALYLEESIDRGLTWTVEQPNDESLWTEIRRQVGAFLEDLFRRGALQGRTPAEAYFVRCGAETTTQEDLDGGIVDVAVGFAPLRPAEFVVLTVRRRLNAAPSA